MSNWEELATKYGQAGSSAAANNSWDDLKTKYAQPGSTDESGVKTSDGDKTGKPKEVGTADRLRALATGVNKGFYSDLLGLPVDTAANVIDLGKAAFGMGMSALGRPDMMPEVNLNRSGVVGSADWIAKKLGDVGLGSAVTNPNPQDPISRIAHTSGRVAGASIVPSRGVPISLAQNTLNMGRGAVSGIAAGTTAEVAPDWAGVAGMAPQLVGAASIAGIKRGIRGDEAGRQNMAQRTQDFKNSGVDSPSVGLATGNQFIQGVENLLSLTPGSVGIYGRSRQGVVDGMQNRTNQIRDGISRTYGPVESGIAIQADLKGPFKERISNTYGLLNDKVEGVVGSNTPIPVTESVARSGLLSAPIGGAEATSSNFINPRIAKINRDLKADAGGLLAQTVPLGGLLDASGIPLTRTIPGTPPVGVPFSAVKDLRTKIGKEAASNAIMGTPEQADFKQLYGSMSQDMKNGVAMADMRSGVMPTAPGSATTALNRANTYYSKAMQRADDLNPIANRSTPEGAYNAVAGSLNSGPTIYQKLRGAVKPETRQKVVATIIDEMGVATPGQQGAAGDIWSPKTFLTNYNKLDQQSKTEMFKRLPGGEQHAKNLSQVAKAAEMLNDSSKVWANPSGTGAALAARGTIGAIGVGAFFQPLLAAKVAGGLVLANQVSQRLLLNPIFVNWLAKSPTISPVNAQSYVQRLIANAKLSGDRRFQEDVTAYLRSKEDQSE